MKQRSNGNFFSLPNEIFLLGLCPGELAVYSYLRRCEDRGTHQCWPSYKTIGKAVGMSENTVGTTSLKQLSFCLRSNAHCYIPDYPASNPYLLAAFGLPFFFPQFFFIFLLTFYLQTSYSG